MKKLYKVLIPSLFLLFIFACENICFASSVITPVPNKANPSPNAVVKYIKASEFVKLSPREFSNLTGKKLNVFQKLSFKIAKVRMKHDLKKNPDLRITDYLKVSKNEGSTDWLWLILGIAGPIVGIFTGSVLVFALFATAPVIVAYATKQDKNKIKSVWLGFALGLLLLLILVLIVAASLVGGWA